MRKIILLLTLLIYYSSIYSQADKVEVVKSSSGFKLKVNGKDFIINGMNWDYYPIGTNYSYSLWKQSDYTTALGYSGSTYIQPSGLTAYTYTINKTIYDSATTFDLDSHMTGLTSNYLGTYSASDFATTTPQFGDEQPFPGSVRLVRGSDIEEFNFLINLPIGKFSTTQNPTHTTGKDVYMTEIALLDINKNALVVAKTPTPIKRTGAQVFSVRLDF